MNGSKAPNILETKWGNVHFHYSHTGKPYYKTYSNNKKYPNKFGMFHEWISCEIINELIDDSLFGVDSI